MRLSTNIFSFLIIVLLSLSQPALALDGWPPVFNKDTNVFLGHALEQDEAAQFQNPKFQAELKRLELQENLDIFVIVTRTDDQSLAVNNTGPVLVRNLMESWSLQGDFPEARSLIILLTGPKEGPLASVGVRAGSYLNSLGITRAILNDPSGPVKGAAKSYLSTDPRKAVLTIIDNINTLADKHIHDLNATAAAAGAESVVPGHDAKAEAGYSVTAMLAIALAIILTGGFLAYVLISDAEHAAHPHEHEEEDELKGHKHDEKEA